MIGRAIAAARDAVAEVVVVDSGSTDATLAIAEAAGARVFRQEWLGNGRQKRFAEDQCRNDFVLDLDADEVVTPALAAEIRSLFAAGAPARSIYELKVVTVPPVGGQWPNFMVAHRRKLYNRQVVRAPDHKAWDQFDVPAGVPVGRLSGELLHHSYRDFAHIAEKLNRISTTRAREGRAIRAYRRGAARAVRSAVLLHQASGVSRPVPGRHLRLRDRGHCRSWPLVAGREDVRAASGRSGTQSRGEKQRPIRSRTTSPNGPTAPIGGCRAAAVPVSSVLAGGPGRTRTCNQTVMSRRL